MFFEYSRRNREVKRYISGDSYKVQIWSDKTDILELFLALSVFYNSVLMPLRGAVRSSYKMFRHDISGIKIGKYILNKEDSDSIERAIKQFHWILHRYGIGKNLFEKSDIKTFVDELQEFLDEE